jgi:hypothetical protein
MILFFGFLAVGFALGVGTAGIILDGGRHEQIRPKAD